MTLELKNFLYFYVNKNVDILNGNYTTYIFGLTVKFGLTVRPNGK